MFGVLIFVHELGHFIAARLSKVTIYEFAIGMGPTIVSWNSKKYDTKYALRLFPIGGFVSMAGEDGESDDENAFNKKPFWKRFAILLSGPAMNIILGFILTFAMLLSSAITNRTDEHLGLLTSNQIHSFDENATSNKGENGNYLMPLRLGIWRPLNYPKKIIKKQRSYCLDLMVFQSVRILERRS